MFENDYFDLASIDDFDSYLENYPDDSYENYFRQNPLYPNYPHCYCGNCQMTHMPMPQPMPGGQMPTGPMPGGQMPTGPMPSGQMPTGPMPSGQMPTGPMPSGQMPPGADLGQDVTMPQDQQMPQPMPQPTPGQGPVTDENFVQAPGSPVMQGIYYTQGYLRTQIGKRIRVEFLIGTNSLTDRVGTLLEVGISYIIIQPVETNDRLLCDIYSIKFVTTYA